MTYLQLAFPNAGDVLNKNQTEHILDIVRKDLMVKPKC